MVISAAMRIFCWGGNARMSKDEKSTPVKPPRHPRPDERFAFLRHFRNPRGLLVLGILSVWCGHLYINFWQPYKNQDQNRKFMCHEAKCCVFNFVDLSHDLKKKLKSRIPRMRFLPNAPSEVLDKHRAVKNCLMVSNNPPVHWPINIISTGQCTGGLVLTVIEQNNAVFAWKPRNFYSLNKWCELVS